MKDSRTIYNTTPEQILEIMQKGAAERSKSGYLKLLSKKCEECGNTFQQSREWQSFCSPRCKNAFHKKQKDAVLTLAVERFTRAEALLELAYAENKLLKDELEQLKAR